MAISKVGRHLITGTSYYSIYLQYNFTDKLSTYYWRSLPNLIIAHGEIWISAYLGRYYSASGYFHENIYYNLEEDNLMISSCNVIMHKKPVFMCITFIFVIWFLIIIIHTRGYANTNAHTLRMQLCTLISKGHYWKIKSPSNI